MREPKIALKCSPVEPDSVLLEQLTMLAAASTAPTRSPWWQRAITKSGAAAVAGVLALSGAAYAAHGDLEPIVRSMTGSPAHHGVRHHAEHALPSTAPVASTPVAPAPILTAAKTIHPNNGRRVHGFHSKHGLGAGWMKHHGNQGGTQNQGNGNGNAYGRERQWGHIGNAQDKGHGKKTGQNGASHGRHKGWSHSKGASNSQN